MDALTELNKLYELKEKGILTEEEYNEQKKRILANPNDFEKNPSPITSSPEKSRNIYILIAFFLGCFGVHNFYIGRTTRGILQLILFFLFIFIVPIIILWIWIVVDMLTVKTEGNGKLMSPINGWCIFMIVLQLFSIFWIPIAFMLNILSAGSL